jgi:hypothetical protein
MTRPASRVALGAATLAALSIAGPAPAGESVYGPVASREQAGKRVIPVTACADGVGGFVTAGTSRPGTPNSDVYVVRTQLDGTRIWEVAYDVNGTGAADTGSSIVELRDGSGFVVTGSTRLVADNADVLLMKIDCAGNVRWATQLVGSALDESGLDVIEATRGERALGTRRGDLVVAGYTASPATGAPIGLLVRTNAAGALVWNRRYESPAGSGILRALTETSPAGDIVAVGEVKLPGVAEPRALSLRVNGHSGAFSGPWHCAAARGPIGARSRFDSVIELTRAPFGRHLVMIGSTSAPAWSSDLFLVRTGPDVCGASLQRRVGRPATSALGDEAALDVREVLTPLPIAPVGRLVVAGRAGRPGTTRHDALLQIVDPRALQLMGSGRLYGDHGVGAEQGSAVTPFGNGFVVAGHSDSDFEGAADPRDLYLVVTDGGGRTGCELPWRAPSPQTSTGRTTLGLEPVPFLQQVFRPVAAEDRITEYQRCP